MAAQDADWWKKTVIYHIYPRSFKDSGNAGIGDFKGILEKLDYIASLGVETIWFSPFFDSPQKDFGYDVRNYTEVFEDYGKVEELEAIVKGIHDRGMKVIFDLVMNHTSNEHEWFLESKASTDNDKHDWYLWRDGKKNCQCYLNPFLWTSGERVDEDCCGAIQYPPNNWQRLTGGTAWNYVKSRDQWYFASFLDFQPDLNWRNPDVKDAMFKMVKHWMDFGVDGFRLDIFNSLFQSEGCENNPPSCALIPTTDDPDGFFQSFDNTVNLPEIYDFAKALREHVDKDESKTRFLIGEVFGNPNQLNRFLGDPTGKEGKPGLNLVFMFETMEFTFSAKYFKGIIDKFEKLYPAPKLPVWTFSSHDRPRSQLRLDGSISKGKALACLQLTVRGVPVVYMGEEIGMKQGDIPLDEAKDPLAKNYAWLPQLAISGVKQFTDQDLNRDNARTPFQWTADPNNAGFTKKKEPWLKIPKEGDVERRNVEVQEDDESSMLNTYRALLKLRKEHPILQDGTIRTLNLPCCTIIIGDDLLGYVRESEDDDTKYLIYINFGNNPGKASLVDEMVEGHTIKMLYDTSGRAKLEGDIVSVSSSSGVILVSMKTEKLV